jgi:FkbH-like protein
VDGDAPSVGVAASFSAVALEPFLAFWLERLWPGSRLAIAPYGQVLEELYEFLGARAQARAGEGFRSRVLLLRPEDLLRSPEGVLRDDPATLQLARAHVGELAGVLAAPRASAGAELLVGCVLASPRVCANERLRAFDGWARATLDDTLRRAPAARRLALEGVGALYRVREVHDPFREALAHIPFSDEYLGAIATAIARSLKTLWEPPRKAIALDCDGTLWGGCCGEQPLHTLDPGGPYLELRRFMLAQARAGRLLCLVSRNRERDVLAAFARCAAPLTAAHVAARRVATAARKSDALCALAVELGIAPGSFVLVDDDPVECAQVRAALPAVAVLELPREARRIPDALRHAWELDVGAVTDEDRRRAGAYALEARRRRELAAAPSFAEFLAGLRVQVHIAALAPGAVARAAQLLARTNQFNLTGARCAEHELLALAARAGTGVYTVRVRDRLGDYGLVGVFVLRCAPPLAHLPVLALSCRALRRGVEGRIVRDAAARARAGGCTSLAIAFRATARNAPARAFLDGLAGEGGERVDGESGAREYRFAVDALVAGTGASMAAAAGTAAGPQAWA